MNKKLEHKIQAAKRELYRSVESVNSNFEGEVKSKVIDVKTFGIKNTNSIPRDIFEKFRDSQEYLFLTVDKMADKGRSIDTDVINPITYRCMTGSSSGGPINIIKGINDIAIGTDGGGSVLAPAMSCNLYSVIGAGLNLLVNSESKSTDSIQFTGSIGFIGKNLVDVIGALEFATGIKLENNKNNIETKKVYIPRVGDITLPTGEDMNKKIKELIPNLSGYSFIETDFSGVDDRKKAIEIGEELLLDGIILTYEGPIDVYGYGETIQRSFKGVAARDLTKNSGKYMVKVANMLKSTAVTIPSEEIASGFLVIGKHGIGGARECVNIAKEIDKRVEKSKIFERFFIRQEKQVWNFEK